MLQINEPAWFIYNIGFTEFSISVMKYDTSIVCWISQKQTFPCGYYVYELFVKLNF